MNSRFRKLGVESLEGRSVLSITAFADFNHDGLNDMAELTSPTTITVSLAKPAGGYVVSDILTTPKNQPFVDIHYVEDGDHDGDVDIYALVSKPSGSLQFETYFNHGDGTFDDPIEPVRWKHSKWFV